MMFMEAVGQVDLVNDLAFIHNWNTLCGVDCYCQINTTDETGSNQNAYGIVRFQRGYIDSHKIFYAYEPTPIGLSPCNCVASPPGPCAQVKFGTIDVRTCAGTQVLQKSIPWVDNFYWSEFFGVDHTDAMHFLCNYGCPGGTGEPPSTSAWRKYLRLDSDGALLLETDVEIPNTGTVTYDACAFMSADCQVRFDCASNPIIVTCQGSTETKGPSWLKSDNSAIIGLGTIVTAVPNVQVVSEPDCSYIFGCTPVNDYMVWSIDTASGAFSILGSRPAAPTVPNPMNTSILGNQILRYLDDSVVVFHGVSLDGYIVCEHWSNDGVLLDVFNTGLNTDLGDAIVAMPTGGGGRVGSVSADINDRYVYLRLMYNAGTFAATNGRSKLFRTRWPLSASSQWESICDVYQHSFALANWGQLQVYQAGGRTRRNPQVTLIGAT
jgi:hypothetical protein